MQVIEDTKKEKNIPFSWTGRINVVIMSILPKAIYTFNAIPIKIAEHSSQARTNNPTICMEPQKTPNSQSNVEKKSKAGGITILDFSLYYKAAIIKTVWYWYKNRYIDQWNRIENPEMDPQRYGQLSFDKVGTNIQWNKDSLLSK